MCFVYKIVPDFEHVISHHIQHDDFMAALDVLIKQVRTDIATKFLLTLPVQFALKSGWGGGTEGGAYYIFLALKGG